METAIAIWQIPDDFITDHSLGKIDLDPAPFSLDEATRQLPGGAYTTFRTFGRFQILSLTDHFNRLEETARLADKPVHLDRAVIKQALHQAFIKYPSDEKRVRIILDLTQHEGSVYILIETLAVPSKEDYERGVKVITRQMHRQNPKAKLTGFIKTAANVRHEIPDGIHEVIMYDEKRRVLEGLSSNFFAVKDGVIWTAGEGVLSGITRQSVLEILNAQGLPVNFTAYKVEDLANLDEAFLTSTSRAVLPISEIDEKLIGDGNPGKITRLLMACYKEAIDKDIETI